MVISWLDRDPWATAAFAVPLTLALLAAIVAHPFLVVLVLLLMLGVVAAGAMDFDKGQKDWRLLLSRADDARAQAERMLPQWQLEAGARARAQAAEAEALAAEARARAIRLRV